MAERLLIVDDDIDTLRLIGLMLERQGYEIIAASNGEQALTMARDESPDLIILDVMMPELDGYEVARRLRTDEQTETIPIIMFTAKSQMDDRVTGIEAGADAYLTKPTPPRELFAHIKSILARRKKIEKRIAKTPQMEGKIIGIISTRGGIGVSTVAINLGIMIHKRTKDSVIVSEYRPGYGKISMDLGFANPRGLSSLLENPSTHLTQNDVKNELITHSSGIRVLLASPQPMDGKYLGEPNRFIDITKHLKKLGTYIVLDLGSSLNPIAYNVIEMCHAIIVGLDPNPITVNQTKKLVNDLLKIGIGNETIHFVLVNRIRSSIQLNLTQVQEELGHKITTVFTPAPELAYQATINNNPIVVQQPASITANQFENLSDHIINFLGN